MARYAAVRKNLLCRVQKRDIHHFMTNTQDIVRSKTVAIMNYVTGKDCVSLQNIIYQSLLLFNFINGKHVDT